MIVDAKTYNTLKPYSVIPYDGIAYGHCLDYDHISRYQNLRQITHNASNPDDRFVALETQNAFTTNCEIHYYDVPAHEENRLDIIAYKELGSAQYAWVIAYFNNIEDGFTAREGTRLKIPNSITDLFSGGEMLASVPPTLLNLGSE